LQATITTDCERRMLKALDRLGVKAQLVSSTGNNIVVVQSDVSTMPTHMFSQIDGVAKVVRLAPTCPLVTDGELSTVTVQIGSTDNGRGGTTVSIGNGEPRAVIAGPCSVESLEQFLNIAEAVKESGATMLRGGAFKPRTSPYEFAGLGKEALAYLSEAKKLTGLPVVSEIMSVRQLELSIEHIDVLQIGARNMYNYELLKEAGLTGKPVLLKRSMSATVDEFLHAAEYILVTGNENVILCERGIRTFEPRLRNTLDLSCVALLKATTNLPVLVDPSHATGRRDLVRSMSRAAIAAGADGLLIEVHMEPEKSISDAEQAITPRELALIVDDSRAISEALNLVIETATARAGGLGSKLMSACP
ncbi:MAG: 3-deoxy-7-phosphoheptulonate synthase, partial [Candidatus Obscuribacterales bacterium]|nr:3-deoxy-7-phosphoheptulonate synthase [Candidatus Obscuribacterales bacterium]